MSRFAWVAAAALLLFSTDFFPAQVLGAENPRVLHSAGQTVYVPIIESVMIGTQTQQGISFTSRGQVIAERAD